MELLLEQALAEGNDDYAGKLQNVLDHGLQPTRTALPGATVPRDPATGKPLAVEEGGAR